MHFTLIVAIGWLYVVLLMALAQPTALAAVFTFLFYGLLPVAVIVYIMTTPLRRQRRLAREQAARATPGEPPEA